MPTTQPGYMEMSWPDLVKTYGEKRASELNPTTDPRYQQDLHGLTAVNKELDPQWNQGMAAQEYAGDVLDPETEGQPSPKKGKGGGQTSTEHANQLTMPQEIAYALTKYTGNVGNLAQEGQTALSDIEHMSTSVPSSMEEGLSPEQQQQVNALQNASGEYTAALEKGQKPIEKAIGQIAPSEATLAQDLPYSDVLQTLLTEQKNRLLYGTIPTYTVNTKGWSDSLKDIYEYISGTKAGTTPSPTTGADQLPSITSAIKGDNQNTGTIPGTGGNPGNGLGP